MPNNRKLLYVVLYVVVVIAQDAWTNQVAVCLIMTMFLPATTIDTAQRKLRAADSIDNIIFVIIYPVTMSFHVNIKVSIGNMIDEQNCF